MLVPVPVLYGTPGGRGGPPALPARPGASRSTRVELGEEPDGQLVTPEDYGALYLQVARALRGRRPGDPARRPRLPDHASPTG